MENREQEEIEPCVSITIDPNNNKLNVDDFDRICTIGMLIVINLLSLLLSTLILTS
uniref:Uncharacterized protein n=1 Tax=Ascaris lumbricoides TaxID=6252 RepID=A0A0M3HJV6_ASCLU